MDKKDLIIVREGAAQIYVHSADKDSIPSKSMNVFYNKKMEINRDISNLAILAYNKLYNQDSLIIVDSMAASGISSIRMLIELELENIKTVYINDVNPLAVDLIRKNISANNLNNSQIQIIVSRKDANFLFSEIAQKSCISSEKIFNKPNIISIDPFGTPNLYLDSAFKAIQRVNSLMCVTATDTAVLFGIRPNACLRKYMSKSLHNEYCKEIGARILIYFISRMANINKMGIIPLLTFYSNHFIRVFAITIKEQSSISKNFKKYGYIFHCKNCNYRTSIESNILDTPKECPSCNMADKLDFAGPLWVGKIHDKQFLEKIIELNNQSLYKNKNRIDKIIKYALEEINMPISYYNIHKLTQNVKLNFVPKFDDFINAIKEHGYKASRTHFDFTSIKTDMDLVDLKQLISKIQRK